LLDKYQENTYEFWQLKLIVGLHQSLATLECT